MNELEKFFRERGISHKEIAEKTGINPYHIHALLIGAICLKNDHRIRLVRAFPDITADSFSGLIHDQETRLVSLMRMVEALKRSPTDECVEWPFTHDPNGYGTLAITRGTTVTVHRLAYELYHGKPAVNFVCHHCDFPPCLNPAHLYDGTPADNGRDRRERGTSKFTLARKVTRNGNQ